MNQFLQQNEWVRALSWTLLHSIWQGLCIALIAGVLMAFTKQRSARFRYNAFVSLLGALLLLMVGTFCWEISSSQLSATSTASLPSTEPVVTISSDVLSGSGDMNSMALLDRVIQFIDQHIATIFFLWMVFFVGKLISLIGGFTYVQRVRNRHIFLPPAEWAHKFELLAQKLRVKKTVKLFESGIVKVPVVMGLLKPVVLVPVGMFNGLPANEVEAILLHELAHIKRADYLVNVLQQFVESVLFFNPAILWLSSLIREERENCCDDLAIGITNNKAAFVHALVSFQEYASSLNEVQLALVNRKYPLLNRVQRIISSHNHSLNAIEKFVLSLGFCLLVLLSFVMANDQQQPIPEKEVLFTQEPVANSEFQQIDTTRNDKREEQQIPVTAKVTPVVVDTLSQQVKQTTTVTTHTQTSNTVHATNSQASSTAVTSSSSASATASANGNDGFVMTNTFATPPATPGTTEVQVQTNVPSQQDQPKKDAKITSLSKSSSKEDDGSFSDDIKVEYKDGQRFRMKRDNGKITTLVINGKRIEESAYDLYKKEIKILEDLWANK